MSVILDALRRRRESSDAHVEAGDARRRVPAALGLDGSPSRPRPVGPGPWAAGLTAVVLLVGAVVWALSSAGGRRVEPAPAASETPSSQPVAFAPPPAPPAFVPSASTPRPAGIVSVSGDGPTPKRTSTPAPAPSTVPTASDFEMAVRYHRLGRFEPALEHYRLALAKDELNVEARNNLGLLYRERGRTGDALEQFRQATAIRPDYVKARTNLAVVLTSLGRLTEARAELRAALEREPRSADMLVNMALVEKADRNSDAAIGWLSRALEVDPGHSLAHYNLAILYDEDAQPVPALEHYGAFLSSVRPEQAGLVEQVQRRVQSLAEGLRLTAR